MKATTWLCPILTLLCASRLVCTAQRGAFPLDYADSNMIQDDYLLEKRNKPSLSIVNPLDVLRQRLLLEIARRQMKENTRQVELNRAILKNVGKRLSPTARRYQFALQQHQHQLQKQPHYPMPIPLDYVPSRSLFDFLQRPAIEALYDEKNSLDTGAAKQQQQNGNEIGNETNHEHAGGTTTASLDDNDNENGNGDGNGAVAGNAGLAMGMLADNANDDLTDEAHPGYQLRYLYNLHGNHYTKK